MQKKMVARRNDYEQQEKSKYRTKQFLTYNFVFNIIIIVIHEYETKLTANEEEQKELLRVLEQTKRMAYARDQQISMLESDGQLMLEKCEY